MTEVPSAPIHARDLLVEGGVSLCAATLFTLSCLHIDVDPQERLGQISGLASLGLRFTIATIVLVIALTVASRWRGGVAFATTARLACAALAGLASAFVAGGIIVALHGTSWGLNGAAGDAGNLIRWSRGLDVSDAYPPLGPKILGWYTDLFGFRTEYALKHLQIMGTAALGPCTYLAWRLLLRPAWALGIGGVASLPLLEAAPYKPYALIVLVALVPLLVRFLDELRTSERRSRLASARRGLAFGVVFGVLFLLYSGWFQWAAPGVIVATLVLFPWRQAAGSALVLVGGAATTFLAITGSYLIGVLSSSALADQYAYFDVFTEPAYIAMWKGDLPGPLPMWPPFGELGGVGVFTLVVIVGFGAAVALGRGRTLVISVAAIMAGAWLLRFWYASQMFDTRLVQLYPRTTALILYCLLVLAGFAVYLLVERHRQAAAESPIHSSSGLIGAICALALLFGSAASSISNAYMPRDTFPHSYGRLAWTAHHPKQFKWGHLPPRRK